MDEGMGKPISIVDIAWKNCSRSDPDSKLVIVLYRHVSHCLNIWSTVIGISLDYSFEAEWFLNSFNVWWATISGIDELFEENPDIFEFSDHAMERCHGV